MAVQNCWFPAVLLVICLHLVGGSSLKAPRIPDGGIHSGNNKARFMSLDERGMIRDGEDMLVSPKQHRRLYSGVRERNAGRTVATPWTDATIPYEIKDGDFDDDQKNMIMEAMKTWSDVTCIQFRPADQNDVNKVLIATGEGCSAALGMAGGTQNMTLDHESFWIGTIAHMFGHAIGLIHEVQRPQRDGYVRVDYYGVPRGKMPYLLKYAKGSEDKMGLPYDYTSLMHYSISMFVSSWYQSIYLRDPTKNSMAGWAMGPSFLDAKFVNLMYDCKSKCGNPPNCPDDCIVNADCQCICEKDFPKEPCEDKLTNCSEWDCSWIVDYLSNCRKTCGYCTELTAESGPCEDKRSICKELAELGECHRDLRETLRDCKKSCDFCPEDLGKDPTAGPGCVDYDTVCQFWADNGLCQKHYVPMMTECPQACGKCKGDITLPDGCVDKDESCHERALSDECVENPEYMMVNCNKSCSNCPGLDIPDKCINYDLRCRDWKWKRLCTSAWMQNNCRFTCETCGIDCLDKVDECADMAAKGECETKAVYMGYNCKKSCNLC